MLGQKCVETTQVSINWSDISCYKLLIFAFSSLNTAAEILCFLQGKHDGF